MNKCCKKSSLLLTTLLLGSTLLTSCKGLFYVYDTLDYDVCSQSGALSFCLNAYYDSDKLTIIKDEQELKDAFKGDKYKFIAYDTIKGLDLCEEYGKYTLCKNYMGGSHTIISLKENVPSFTNSKKIIANNEKGSLGAIISYLYPEQVSNITYIEDNSRTFYENIVKGKYSEEFDYLIIDQAFACRLTDETLRKEYSTIVYAKEYKYVYYDYIKTNERTNLFYPEGGVFVNKEFLSSNYKDCKTFITSCDTMTDKNVDNVGDTTQIINGEGKVDAQWEKFDLTVYDVLTIGKWELLKDGSYNKPNLARYTTSFKNSQVKDYLELIGKEYANLDSIMLEDDYFSKVDN